MGSKNKVKEYQKNYYKLNKGKLLEYRKKYYDINKDKILKYLRCRYKDNSTKFLSYNKANPQFSLNWRKNNPEYMKVYLKNPKNKLSHTMRLNVRRVIKLVGTNKQHKSFKYFGCTPEELKNHIESLFKPGMSWSNWSKDGWHIDHIKPLSSYIKENIMESNHYTNLQPLWAKDNLSKHGKIQ